jgi:hypothetical protein
LLCGDPYGWRVVASWIRSFAVKRKRGSHISPFEHVGELVAAVRHAGLRKGAGAPPRDTERPPPVSKRSAPGPNLLDDVLVN